MQYSSYNLKTMEVFCTSYYRLSFMESEFNTFILKLVSDITINFVRKLILLKYYCFWDIWADNWKSSDVCKFYNLYVINTCVSVTHMYSVVLVNPRMRKVTMVVFMLVNFPITGGEEGVVKLGQFTGAQHMTYLLYLLTAWQHSSAEGVHDDTHMKLG